MALSTSTKQDALEATKRLWDDFGSFKGISDHLEINVSHPWQAIRNEYVTPKLVGALIDKGHMEKPAPKDPRPRVWMRTDDIDLATETFLRYYPYVEIKVHMPDIQPGKEVGVICPECSADTRMVIRRNKKNGTLFLGCPNWPKCQYTSPIPEHIKMEAAGQPSLFA
jgi:hypothetical protein